MDQVPRANLLTTSQRETGAWFNVLPVPSLGTLLRLGLPLPSKWALIFVFPIHVAAAGGWTEKVCMYGLSCFPRHLAMNNVIKSHLAVLGPSGFDRGHESYPDNKKVFPFNGEGVSFGTERQDTLEGYT